MPDLGLTDILQVTFKGSIFNETLLTTFHYKPATIDGNPTLNTALDGLYASLNGASLVIDKFLACCPANYFLNQTWIQCIATTRYAKKIYATASSGTREGDARTANVAAVISRKGELATRYAMGSVHIPVGNDVEDYANGLIANNLKTALTTFAARMLVNPVIPTTTTTFIPVLYNKGRTPNYTHIVSTDVQTTVRVMRRRTVGLGI